MIHFDSPNIGNLEKDCVRQALDEGSISTHSHFVTDFEKAMAEYLGVDDCIATNSGTSALHLALVELGIGIEYGYEISIPALTFPATKNVLRYVGAKPIVADVDVDTWLLPRQKILALPVDLYGNINLDYAPLIDAAESLGGRERHEGFVCYSFNGNKVMTTGGGGLLVGTNLNRIRQKINPGHYNGIGYNYSMTGLSAALGLSQLKSLPYFIKKKRRFNRIYREKLNGLVKFQEATPGSDPSWWMTACTFPDDINIVDLQEKLKVRGIPTKRIFKPLADLPNATHIYEHGLCLPSSTLNGIENISEVCKEIKEVI